MRILVIGSLILFTVLCICWCRGIFNFISAEPFGPTYKKIELTNSDKCSMLYIKTKNWGVTGDHQITVLSTDSTTEFNAMPNDVLFEDLAPFSYLQHGDTLYILSSQQPIIPKSFAPHWVIKYLDKKGIEREDYMFGKRFDQL